MSSNEWREVKLEECTSKIFSGGTPSTKNNLYWDGNIPWLSSGETRQTFIYRTEKNITQLGVENSSTKLAEVDDVVIASAGQGHTRGQTSLCKVDTYINQSIISLRSDKKELEPHFLFYNIFSRYEELRQISDGHSIRGSLTTKIIKNLNIKLPSINEQKAIANILSSLDEKIEVNNQINETLEKMAQELFKRWFLDFEFPNEEGEPYQSSGGEMVESELGMVPKGWKVEHLENVVDVIDNRGKTPPLSKEKTFYPIIDVKALSGISRIINYENCKKFVDKYVYDSWFRNGHPLSGDILLSTVGTIGELKIFYGTKGCIAQNVVALRPKNISHLFLYQYLIEIKNDLISYNIGSVQPSIKITHVKKHKILIPHKVIEDNFISILDEISDMVYHNYLQNKVLLDIRDTLLPKLMSGELRVPLEELEESLTEVKGG